MGLEWAPVVYRTPKCTMKQPGTRKGVELVTGPVHYQRDIILASFQALVNQMESHTVAVEQVQLIGPPLQVDRSQTLSDELEQLTPWV